MAGFTLDPESLRVLKRVVQQVLHEQRGEPARRRQTATAGPVIQKGKITGDDLAAGGSTTVTIWARTTGVEASTGDTVTAYDWMLSTGYELVTGSEVVVAWMGGEWYVIESKNCPTAV